MNTAIIVVTHKRAAAGLIEAAGMVFGEPENLVCIEFSETDSIDALTDKYKEAIKKNLNIEDGLLYLVDLFGGSPFHAACRMAVKHPDQEVVTGVNMPMLLEVLSCRSFLSCTQLAKKGILAGINGIRRFQLEVHENEGDE